MNSLKEGQFPATSIGRLTGARLQQAAAHEAHPLLSPGAATTDNGAPKYVPYTPRQRGVSAATATGTVVHPPSPQYQHGNAAAKLQLMHLKAAVQNVGLDSSTVGWAILEKIGAFNDGEDWNEILHAITMGKASLLLPLEPMSTRDKITSDFVKDHVYFWDGSSEVVTMSGLRGTLSGQILAFRSSIPPSSKVYQDLLSPISRSSAFSLLPHLPQFTNSYPKVAIQSEQTIIPLPPRASVVQKPPLPPRPAGRGFGSSQNPSRIPNPFASLFGGNPSKNAPNAAPASPPASIRSFDSSSQDSVPIDITIVTTDRKIIRKDIAKAMNKTLKTELREMLLSATTPPPIWVLDRVNDFTAEWFPFIRIKDVNSKQASDGRAREYEPNPFEENPDDAADRIQEFFVSLEQDLRASGSPFLPSHRNTGNDRENEIDDEKGRGRREREQDDIDTRIRDVMEAVERSICSLFYDKLFMQAITDDASHDETLTSRIYALNRLDLGLEHLDVLIGHIGPDLEVVVQACGEMLSQIDPCRCPADKSVVLVAAHKVLVDGLSRLPPVRLKTDQDEPMTAKPLAKPTPEPVLSHINILRSTSSQSIARDVQDGETPTIASMARMSSGDSATPSLLPISTPLPAEFGSASEPIPILHPAEPTTRSEATREKPAHLTLQLEPRLNPDEPTPVSGDVLFPMLIFSVVKANPPHLLSNLLFTQRFRNHAVGGEESYCLINLMAVAEFLENVDLEGLGLTDTDNVLSAADLTPFLLTRSPVTSETPLTLTSVDGPGGLRGRMEQQVDAIADSANKVISGVVDSSFGILRSFLPNTNHSGTSQSGGSRPPTPGTPAGGEVSSGWKSTNSMPKPGFGGLLRRDTGSSAGGGSGSGFSIANIAASLPIAGRSRANTANSDDFGQQLINVSRPGSARSRTSLRIQVAGESSDEESENTTDDGDEAEGDGDEDDEGDESAEPDDESKSVRSSRSIQSFESMVAAEKAKNLKQKKHANKPATTRQVISTSPISESRPPRKTLSDRLARVSSNLASSTKTSGSPSVSRQNSLLLRPPHSSTRARSSESPASSRSPSPVHPPPSLPQLQIRLAPPIQRFVDGSLGDLRLSEVGELLRDYRRLVEAIRTVNGFDE